MAVNNSDNRIHCCYKILHTHVHIDTHTHTNIHTHVWSFSGGSVVKNLPVNAEEQEMWV